MAIKAPASQSTVSKSTGTSPAGKKPAKPTAKAPTRAPAQKDEFVKSSPESKGGESSGFSSFLGNVRGAFGQLQSSTKPLDFSENEKRAGLSAANTLDRLAGPDGTWDRNDLAKNMAQLQTSSGFRGAAERTLAHKSLFEAHKVPKEEQARILDQSRQIKKDNPNIAKLHKLEGINPEKITDPEQRAKYDELKSQWTSDLSEKGLLPVDIPKLKEMGTASQNLQNKLKENGLPVPEGQPVNTNVYRGLFQGKAPLSTQLGL